MSERVLPLFYGTEGYQPPKRPDPGSMLAGVRARTWNKAQRIVTLHLSSEQHARLSARAAKNGLKTTTFAKRLVLGEIE